jgi:hypothetical protein
LLFEKPDPIAVEVFTEPVLPEVRAATKADVFEHQAIVGSATPPLHVLGAASR